MSDTSFACASVTLAIAWGTFCYPPPPPGRALERHLQQIEHVPNPPVRLALHGSNNPVQKSL